ncbi:MAG TPA: Ig-like domain-containing protein, partial [Bacteroidota bacterium]|nr:Ig-like domain-containing protein [Bacteroidota bacterium]
MVLSTIPPNGAVGPFKEFHATGEISSDMPYFFVQFNKLMAPYTGQIQICSECTGFDHPVAYTYGTYGNGIYAFYLGQLYPEGYYNRVNYKVGKKYSFTIDSTFVDVNGNPLSAPYTFSITPEPYLRV